MFIPNLYDFFFCGTQKMLFWSVYRCLEDVFENTVKVSWFQNNNGPLWLSFFKISSSFAFCRRQVIQVWNEIRVGEWPNHFNQVTRCSFVFSRSLWTLVEDCMWSWFACLHSIFPWAKNYWTCISGDARQGPRLIGRTQGPQRFRP